MYHVYGSPIPIMALTQFSTHKNPIGNDRTKTTLGTGASTCLRRQFERLMTNSMMLLAMGYVLHIRSTILPPMNSYTRWNKVTKIWKILSSISS